MEKVRSRLGGGQAWLIWSLAVVFVIWLFNLQTGYSVLSSQIQNDLLLTVAQVGLVSSIYTWAFSIVQLISGPLLDRFGVRKCMPIAVILVAAGAFFYSVAQGMGSLVIAQILLAIGAAFGFVGAGFVGGVWFSPLKYGLMFGLVQAFASLGSAIGTPMIDYFSNLYDWRAVLSAFFFFGIFLVAAFFLWVKDPQPKEAVEASTKSLPSQIIEDLTLSVKRRDVSLSAIIAGVSFGLMLAVGTLWGPRIVMAHGYSESAGVIATSLMWLGLAVGAPLYNIWSNKVGKRKSPFAIGILFQLVIVMLIIFLATPSESLLMLLMFLLGFSAGAHMLGFTIAGEVVPGKLVGSASAIVNAVCFIFGGLMMSIPAYLLPAGVPTLDDFRKALIIMPVLLVGAFLLSLMIRESYGKDPAPIK